MNKKWILIIIVLLAIFIAGYFLPTPIQVTRENTDTNHRVSVTDLATAKELFQKNNIEMGTLAIVQVTKDRHDTTHVGGAQFYNDLPVFFGNITYHFDQSGKAQDRSIIDNTNDIFTSGERVGDLGILTKPSISISTAARKAREKIKANYFFTAELGFWDSIAGTSYGEPNFILVWKVKSKRADEYPYAFVDANSGKLLRYWDGIIIN